MTRRSKRELERAVDELTDETEGPPITFAEFYEYYHYSVEVHGALGAGPSPEEFFGRKGRPADCTDFWKLLLRVWDGDEDPPLDQGELEERLEKRKEQRGVTT